MSKLALESFIAFKPAAPADGYEFFPKQRDVSRQGKNLVVTLGDVPLPGSIPHPQNGLTTLYGFRDALEEMQLQYAAARRNGMSLVKVTFNLDVKKIVMGTTNPDTIGDTRFLNLRRLSKDLQQLVLDGVNELSAKEGKKAKFYDRILHAGERPDLICAVIRSLKVFSHINSVVYMVPDGTPRGRQVATVFSTRPADDEESGENGISGFSIRGECPFQIKLPKIG